MHKYINFIFLGAILIFTMANFCKSFASEGINAEELGKHYKNYYKENLEVMKKMIK